MTYLNKHNITKVVQIVTQSYRIVFTWIQDAYKEQLKTKVAKMQILWDRIWEIIRTISGAYCFPSLFYSRYKSSLSIKTLLYSTITVENFHTSKVIEYLNTPTGALTNCKHGQIQNFGFEGSHILTGCPVRVDKGPKSH